MIFVGIGSLHVGLTGKDKHPDCLMGVPGCIAARPWRLLDDIYQKVKDQALNETMGLVSKDHGMHHDASEAREQGSAGAWVDSGRLGFSDKEAMALPLKGRDPSRKVRSMPFHPVGALKLTWERQTH